MWDNLDQWHSRLAVLESEVQEVAMEAPEKAHALMDELTDPLQLYQIVAKQAEQRTTFLGKVNGTTFPSMLRLHFPACLSPTQNIIHRAYTHRIKYIVGIDIFIVCNT